MIFIDDRDIGADTSILIENRPLHRGALTDTHRNPTTFTQQSTLITGFEEISTHYQGVLQNNIGFNTTSHAENAVMNTARFQNRSFADNRIGDLSINEFAGWQVARTGVDRELLVEN